jgi:hypothetical protein
MNIEIEKVIEALRDGDRCIESIFTMGGCYKFYLFLKSIYPDATPYISIDKGHVVTAVHDELYDINGMVSADEYDNYSLMTDDDIAEAKNWSFSRTHALSLGECKYCEEPILF